jgi:hypothetical protein
MRRAALAFVLLAWFAGPAFAQTLTTKEIVELTKAGLSEEVLLALIEVHRSVFPIDRETLMALKAQGVRDNVIVAMIRSGREPVPVPPPPPPAPTTSVIVDRGDGTPELIIKDRAPEQTRVVVVEDRDEPRYESRTREERVREVPVAVPVYVPVTTTRSRQRVHDRIDDRIDAPSVRREPEKRAEPVYWGFGGKLRPDAWQPSEPPKSDKKTDNKKKN